MFYYQCLRKKCSAYLVIEGHRTKQEGIICVDCHKTMDIPLKSYLEYMGIVDGEW